MREEFHGDGDGVGYKKLYGWNSINTNAWLPSLCELTGYNPNHYNTTSGAYYPDMRGLNISSFHNVDTKGGSQFSYFQQYNASGGGEKLWTVCNREMTWLRSPYHNSQAMVWRTTNETDLNAIAAVSASLAVHPAAGYGLKTRGIYPNRIPGRGMYQTAWVFFA